MTYCDVIWESFFFIEVFNKQHITDGFERNPPQGKDLLSHSLDKSQYPIQDVYNTYFIKFTVGKV